MLIGFFPPPSDYAENAPSLGGRGRLASGAGAGCGPVCQRREAAVVEPQIVVVLPKTTRYERALGAYTLAVE